MRTADTTTDRSSLLVATIAGALFCVVLIYLALQVRAGQDPAIGAIEQSPVTGGPRQVVVRRIVVRRIVEEQAGPAPAAGGQTTFAPAPAAPVAPAPAPVVSSGS